MAAVVRGGPTSRPKPRASGSAPSKPRGSKPRDYAPAKLAAARKVGLPPKVAGLVAAGVVGLGLVAALMSGHHLRDIDRKSTRLNSSHFKVSRMQSSA